MMVQFPNLEKLRSEPKQLFGPLPAARARVKSEIEDPLDEMYGPIGKRSKFDESVEQQLESKLVMPHGSLYDPLDEPSPLGLRLKKSPSFLDMIQTRLYQENSVSTSATSSGLDFTKKKELKSTAISGGLDKMKASNFPAAVLRIGNWEYLSRYEGDLVAKCYYAKHKLVWEVLDGGLKNKIEIQWSDITALKATCPENEPATLDIVLARRPLFFRETNPQPRKHTLWQATSDFTGGQASIHRRHFLQCHQGLLNRHFDKLIQCDPRLKTLNQQPEIVLESSCFEPSCLDDQDDPKGLGFDNGKENDATTSAGFQDSNLSYAKSELRDKIDEMLDRSTMQMHYHDSESPSFIGVQAADEVVYRGNRKTSEPSMQYEEPNARKLRPSMSKDDLVNHLEQCISKQMASGNPLFSTGCLPDKENLEELAEHLLTDSQSSVFDEKSLLSKVNSFYGLLQRDSSFPNLHLGIGMNTADHIYSPDDDCDQLEEKEALDDAQPCGLSRKESFGELLMNLPRIASFPQFLFCIDEDNDD